MTIDTLQVVAKTATTIDLTVNNSDPAGRTAAALRDTATGDAFDNTDKQDLIDGVAGDINIDVVSSSVTALRFEGLDPLKTYHVGTTNYAPEAPPPEPTPGDVPAATSLSSPSSTSTTISLVWAVPYNAGANANMYAYDFPDDNEQMPPQWYQYSEGVDVGNGRDIKYAPKRSTEQSRSGSGYSLKFHFSPAPGGVAETPYRIGRQEMHYMSGIPVESKDFFRFQQHEDYAIGYSIYLGDGGYHNSYQIMGQWHDSLDHDIGEIYTDSPVMSLNLQNGTAWYNGGCFNSEAATPAPKGGQGAEGSGATWSHDRASERGRWIDVVRIYRFDAEGASTWPLDGTAPYDAHMELWIDGVLRATVPVTTATGLGNNDAPERMHYAILGVYTGWKDPDDDYSGDYELTAYYDSIYMASGADATYENVCAAGKCHGWRLEEETSPNVWTEVATTPPSVTEYTHTGLSSGAHKYRVKGIYDQEASAPTDPLTVNI